jgi:hypothetical protein
MTQEEFNEHHKDFIKSYSQKWIGMDLNFDTIMIMNGLTREEFNEKMKVLSMERPWNEKSGFVDHGDVDEEDSDYDSFSRGGESKRDDGGDDANEY